MTLPEKLLSIPGIAPPVAGPDDFDSRVGLYWRQQEDGLVRIGVYHEMSDGTCIECDTALTMKPEIVTAFCEWWTNKEKERRAREGGTP